MRQRDPGFRAHAVRDALGLVRILWLRAQRERDLAFEEHIPYHRENELEAIGAALREALVLGRARPGTGKHTAAIQRADAAVDRLCALGDEGELSALVRLVRDRVRDGRRREYVDERELKRQSDARRR